MTRLGAKIDALAEKDRVAVQRAREISHLRRRAAVELHGVCAGFVQELNAYLHGSSLAFDPPEFGPEQFREDDPNLFQINMNGRILQIEFESADQLLSTEEFRVPYTLKGAVRSFNQSLLDQGTMEEQLLFYSLERDRMIWRYFDARTYRTGAFDREYLAELLEKLV